MKKEKLTQLLKARVSQTVFQQVMGWTEQSGLSSMSDYLRLLVKLRGGPMTISMGNDMSGGKLGVEAIKSEGPPKQRKQGAG